MKGETVAKLRALQTDLKELRKQVRACGYRVANKDVGSLAEEVATRWVEDHRSVLEYKFSVDSGVIRDMSEGMKRLHVLARPNNRKTSYLQLIDGILDGFEDRLVLPVQQFRSASSEAFSLEHVIPGLA